MNLKGNYSIMHYQAGLGLQKTADGTLPQQRSHRGVHSRQHIVQQVDITLLQQESSQLSNQCSAPRADGTLCVDDESAFTRAMCGFEW